MCCRARHGGSRSCAAALAFGEDSDSPFTWPVDRPSAAGAAPSSVTARNGGSRSRATALAIGENSHSPFAWPVDRPGAAGAAPSNSPSGAAGAAPSYSPSGAAGAAPSSVTARNGGPRSCATALAFGEDSHSPFAWPVDRPGAAGAAPSYSPSGAAGAAPSYSPSGAAGAAPFSVTARHGGSRSCAAALAFGADSHSPFAWPVDRPGAAEAAPSNSPSGAAGHALLRDRSAVVLIQSRPTLQSSRGRPWSRASPCDRWRVFSTAAYPSTCWSPRCLRH